MYADPACIRNHEIKIRVNDIEANLIDALVAYTGQQKAVLLREMILEQARIDMGLDGAGNAAQSEAPQMALFRA